MINVMYAMTEIAVNSFVQFKSDLEKLRATATPGQIDKVTDAITKMSLSTGQAFSIDEETGAAIIPIIGTLTPKPEFCISLSDGSQTLYPSIVESIKIAESMPSVKQLRFNFDTPGGWLNGIESAAIAIKECTKPTIGVVVGQACSGGFWLLSQCDKKVAATPLAELGSIGVVIEAIDRSEKDKQDGIKRIVLTSRNAPEKFHDIGTKPGREKIIDRMTKSESVFIDRVAEGFGVTAEKVKSDFGRGGVLIAKDALKLGMIEKIDENLMNSIESANTGIVQAEDINKKKIKGASMNLQEFLNQNLEAAAEQKALITAAVAGEKKRADEILSLSGVILTDEAKAAISGITTAGDFAKSQLTAQNAVRESASNVDNLGSVNAGSQTPGDTAIEDDLEAGKTKLPKGTITSEEQAIAAAIKQYGDKK